MYRSGEGQMMVRRSGKCQMIVRSGERLVNVISSELDIVGRETCSKYKAWILNWSFLSVNVSLELEGTTMKIKVHTNEKNLEKHSASKFTKFIRLLSKVYIIPIGFKNDFKDVKLSLISLRTLVFLAVISVPFLSSMIWLCVFQWDFTSQYFEKSLHVYHLFDFVQMFVMNMFMWHPLSTLPMMLWSCYLWVSFPALSQVYMNRIHNVKP